MIGSGSRQQRAWSALALALAAAPLSAQSVSDYRLPEARPSESNTRAQGPVDADNPLARQPVVRPSASAAPTPTPAQSGPAANPVVTEQAPVATPTPRQPAPVRRSAVSRPAATPIEDATDSVLSAVTEVASPVATEPAPSFSSTLPQIESAPAPQTALPPWLLPAALGALATALAFAVARWWRMRKAVPAITFEPPRAEPASAPLPPTPRPEAAKPSPPPQPVAAAAPAAAPQSSPLTVSIEARRLTASLMATTLAYRITLSNRSGQPLSALAIEGDMIAAHASLPPDQQIASAAQALALCHALVELAPGESAEFTGEFRLPLAAITPIRSGDAAWFVPLARLRVAASTATGTPLVVAQTFVVGEDLRAAGGTLKPFRLDLGPRTYSQLGQRAVN
jgi:hypothetical protein